MSTLFTNPVSVFATIAERFNGFVDALSEETGLSDIVVIVLIIIATIVVAKLMKSVFSRIIVVLTSLASTAFMAYFNYAPMMN